MRRLIDLPGQLREPSDDLLGRLRAIDPLAEVVYVGNGRWWLGRVKTDSARCAAGRRMLAGLMADTEPLPLGRVEREAALRQREASLLQARLMSQGFSLTSEIVAHEADDRLVEELRRAKYVEQHSKPSDFATPESARALWLRLGLNPEAAAEEEARRDRIRENKVRERDLAKWLWSRSPLARANPAPVTVAANITQGIA
jgi:hypothetical protein